MKRAYTTPSNLNDTSHSLVNVNTVTGNYDEELAGSTYAGPETDIYNSIFKVHINTSHSDWDDYKFTTSPYVFIKLEVILQHIKNQLV